MKKAFTLLELVFVIVVIGILASTVLSRTDNSRLQEAAVQLVSHIRYAQHLAMLDDRYDRTNADWYQERWQIRFYLGEKSDNLWAYTIFKDLDGAGHPSGPEVANDPLDNARLLSGGSVGSVLVDINHNSFQGNRKLNLGLTYGIINVDFSASCQVAGSQRIAFDHLGRSMKGNIHNNLTSYDNVNNLLQARCEITLVSSDGNVSIMIEPETGYAYIL